MSGTIPRRTRTVTTAVGGAEPGGGIGALLAASAAARAVSSPPPAVEPVRELPAEPAEPGGHRPRSTRAAA